MGPVNASETAAYDYVIVGGGSAGCVVASRLAAASPDATVLLIEAGPDGRGVAQVVDPPSWTKLAGTALDWGYAYTRTDAVAGRAIGTPRGRVLGGCSATNAMQWDRGHPADYDAWETAGAAGWTYAAMLPYFRRSEDWEGGATPRRGAGGPMRITRPPEPHPIAAAMVEGAAELGLPRLDDANAGETGGAALANLNIAQGRRFSVVDGYLPAWAPPPAPGQVPVGAWTRAPDPPANLTVLTGSTALRLGFSDGRDGSGLGGRCSSVFHRVRGSLRQTRARTAVVLTLGAFGTPELLVRSGIGDPADLDRLGLQVHLALPGVGRNLQDHPLVMGLNFRARDRLGLTRDNGGGAIMNWRSSRADRPDLHAFVVQGRQAYPDAAKRYGLNGDADVFAVSPGLLRPRGVGRLTVRDLSATGSAAVELESGFLTERADVDALVEAVDTVSELAATAAYRELIAGPVMPRGRLSRAEKVEFVRENCSTFFHPCGTAAMGVGPDAVVGPDLRVHGLDGLYIADASVIPVIPCGGIQAPVIAIAERAADLITGALATRGKVTPSRGRTGGPRGRRRPGSRTPRRGRSPPEGASRRASAPPPPPLRCHRSPGQDGSAGALRPATAAARGSARAGPPPASRRRR
jgi:choline dehydrogenase